MQKLPSQRQIGGANDSGGCNGRSFEFQSLKEDLKIINNLKGRDQRAGENAVLKTVAGSRKFEDLSFSCENDLKVGRSAITYDTLR